MKKLITLLIFILIGLNLSGCDPEETFHNHLYQRSFKNDTNKNIKLIYHHIEESTKVTDTLILHPNIKKVGYFEGSYSSDGIKNDNFKLIIEENISVYNASNDEIPKFELYLEDTFIMEWKGTASYLGGEINSPYNYNSWEVVKYNETLNPTYGEFIYGEIIFTITNKDLE